MKTEISIFASNTWLNMKTMQLVGLFLTVLPLDMWHVIVELFLVLVTPPALHHHPLFFFGNPSWSRSTFCLCQQCQSQMWFKLDYSQLFRYMHFISSDCKEEKTHPSVLWQPENCAWLELFHVFIGTLEWILSGDSCFLRLRRAAFVWLKLILSRLRGFVETECQTPDSGLQAPEPEPQPNQTL